MPVKCHEVSDEDRAKYYVALRCLQEIFDADIADCIKFCVNTGAYLTSIYCEGDPKEIANQCIHEWQVCFEQAVKHHMEEDYACN